MAHPDAEAQKGDVLEVLTSLFGSRDFESRMIEVWNKSDLPDYLEPGFEDGIRVSAYRGDGVTELQEAIAEQTIAQHFILQRFRIPHAEGAARSWLYAHAHVMECTEDAEASTIYARLTDAQIGQITQKFKRVQLLAS